MPSPRWRSRTSPRYRTRHLLPHSRSTLKRGSRPCKRRTSQGGTWNRRAAPSHQRVGPSHSSPSHRRCPYREASPRQGPGQHTHHPRMLSPRWRNRTSPRCRTRHLLPRSRSTLKRESRPCRRRTSQGGTWNPRAAPSRRQDYPSRSSPSRRRCPCIQARHPALRDR